MVVCTTAVVLEKRLSAGEIELGFGGRVTSSEGRTHDCYAWRRRPRKSFQSKQPVTGVILRFIAADIFASSCGGRCTGGNGRARYIDPQPAWHRRVICCNCKLLRVGVYSYTKCDMSVPCVGELTLTLRLCLAGASRRSGCQGKEIFRLLTDKVGAI